MTDSDSAPRKKRPKRYKTNAQHLAGVRSLIKAAGRRASRGDPEDLTALVTLKDTLDDAILTAVRGLRGDGFTWESIGRATGTTRQAAIMKWAHKV
ncbi:MAG: hypothetical protein ACRDYV_00240 [Acidimicrobiia bacterium]